jgi:3-hydroxy-9,10-secoandrosta-1,3,5(10)-triene-9,17-dione monooxygenase reductase component
MSDVPPPVSPAEFRAVLGHYPSGVCVVAARHADGQLAGMAVSSFASVSLNPPLIGFFAGRQSMSWRRIRESRRFCVNVLAADQQWVCHRFASREPDKFNGVAHRISSHGVPLLEGAVANIQCEIESVTPAGDHDFVLGRVIELAADTAQRPLIFFQSGYGHFMPVVAQEIVE